MYTETIELILDLPCGLRLLPCTLTHADDAAAAVVQIHIGVIRRHIGQEVYRRIFIDRAVHVIAEAVLCGVNAAQGKHAAEKIRAAEEQIGGMGGTMFGQNLGNRMDDLERKMSEVQRANVSAPSAPIPSNSYSPRAQNGTIIDRKPQAATIIDLPKSGDTITVQSGSGRGTIYDLPTDDVVVGRDPNSFISVNDGKVSSKHLKLVFEGNGAWSILDLGSTNGTYLNGSRVSGQARLTDGDSIKIGDTVLVFRQGR